MTLDDCIAGWAERLDPATVRAAFAAPFLDAAAGARAVVFGLLAGPTARLTGWDALLAHARGRDARYWTKTQRFIAAAPPRDADALTGAHADHLARRARGHRARAGVWYTPAEVVAAMFDLVGPPPATVHDPSTGTGVFLAEAARRGARHLIGWDREPAALLIASTRCPDAHLTVRDTLGTPTAPPVDLIITNPPWARDKGGGGWVRHGHAGAPPILADFTAHGDGLHRKNLYNQYVYFWRYALWHAFEQQPGPAAICLVTPSSFLRGPAFEGMRAALRAVDELRVVEVGGEGRGAGGGPNLFGVRTPACIVLARRGGRRVHAYSGWPVAAWRPLPSTPTAPLVPRRARPTWPTLAAVFPWVRSGIKAGRTWPIATEPATLHARWSALYTADDRAAAFKDSPTGQRADRPAPALPGQPIRPPITAMTPTPPPMVAYAWRAFDTRWLLADGRLLDRAAPDLWAAHGPQQRYLTTQRTSPLGAGPAAVVCAALPDLHHYAGRGGRDVIPRWTARGENLAPALRARLTAAWGEPPRRGAVFAYVTAALGHPGYTARIYDADDPDLRVPFTLDRALFARGVALGERLLAAQTAPVVPQAHCIVRPGPGRVRHLHDVLHIGPGRIASVPAAVWDFKICTRAVLRRWIGDRLGAGRKSSTLDAIRAPWSPATTRALLDVIERIRLTCALAPALDAWLADVLAGPLVDGWPLR